MDRAGGTWYRGSSSRGFRTPSTHYWEVDIAGDIQTGPDTFWMTSSSIFYWVIDQLAEQARDPRLAEHLREVSQHNLGLLLIEDLEPAQQQEIRGLIAGLPDVGHQTLPDTDGKQRIVEQLEHLAADVRR